MTCIVGLVISKYGDKKDGKKRKKDAAADRIRTGIELWQHMLQKKHRLMGLS